MEFKKDLRSEHLLSCDYNCFSHAIKEGLANKKDFSHAITQRLFSHNYTVASLMNFRKHWRTERDFFHLTTNDFSHAIKSRLANRRTFLTQLHTDLFPATTPGPHSWYSRNTCDQNDFSPTTTQQRLERKRTNAFSHTMWSKESPPPEGVSYLLCSLIKNRV